ncbi:hypothetical protein DQQ10_00280 [Pseudochryseolinea flava]|uniref:Lipoprotein n=1 Tax=Pseudochryseolinea flava TaxID=2059302 RepID=A0A364Y8B1_9BACT|nr:hypothetical protein DQQ10_00280 [Pseudochryseolinea flava]
MKRVLTILVFALALTSCAPKVDESDIDMKRRAIADRMLDNDRASLQLEVDGSRSTRKSVMRLLQEIKNCPRFGHVTMNKKIFQVSSLMRIQFLADINCLIVKRHLF